MDREFLPDTPLDRQLHQDGDSSNVAGAGTLDDEGLLSDRVFQNAFGHSIVAALDVANWEPGIDAYSNFAHIEDEVTQAIDMETQQLAEIRRRILPYIRDRNPNLDEAGLYRTTASDLEHVHKTVLFSGGVEACDGISTSYDTLAMRLIQIGVCLVSYDGDQGTWGHQLFQRELRQTAGSVTDLAMESVARRQQAALSASYSTTERLSNLARRGILRYAERATLAQRATAPWRMGRGNPIPYELLTGGGSMDLAVESTEILNELLLTHKRFVFVANQTAESGILTLGHALRPLEYLVFDTMLERLRAIVDRGHYTRAEKQTVEHFAMTAGPEIVIGVFRASEIAPPRIFYAHRDHVHEAALIAMADSVLLEHRGFPMLLDLAKHVCDATYPASEFNDASELAYTDAGAPLRYLSERAIQR
jgi:hypothetical protein